LEKDLGIKNMNTIAKIEPTKVLFRGKFDKIENLNNDFFDYVVEQYPN
jgi:hypothetical protein